MPPWSPLVRLMPLGLLSLRLMPFNVTKV
jgi:hypothetical protein